MTDPERVDVAVVGAGAAGIGTGVALSFLDLDVLILERDEIGASFRRWPVEMRCITPSFPSNSFGSTDLNAITPDTSPAFTLDREHPSGDEYADYLEAVAEFHELPIETGVEVTSVVPHEEVEREDELRRGTDSPRRGVPAVDGGTVTTASTDDFRLETSDGPICAGSVIWATGQFGNPRTDIFPGAEHCTHTSEIGSWEAYAADHEADEYLIVGGYESGIDAAVALVEASCWVRVLDRGEPWATRSPDPSEVLSPYTLERLDAIAESDRLRVEGGAAVEAVRQRSDGCFDIHLCAADGYELDEGESAVHTVSTRPLLATGFRPNLGPATEFFPQESGTIQLTERDESPTTPGLFLAGPDVTHNGVQFCFIYKFRARFPVVAETIGERVGVDTDPLDVYRAQNMFLDDLSCCEPDMCDC
jgi:putative flavoprotein involved in K+ transport